MKRKYLVLFALLFPIFIMAQNKEQLAYSIQIDFPNLKNEKVYLGRYIMGKPYSNDSIVLDTKGRGVLKGDKALDEGLFLLYFTDGKFVDFIVGNEQHITVKGDTLSLPANLQFGGASQTKDFFQYMLFLAKLQQNYTDKHALLEATEDATHKNQIELELSMYGKQLLAKQDELINKYPNGMVSVFLKGLRISDMPEDEIENQVVSDSLKQVKRYLFYKNHYFDNVNFADIRTYNTPYIVTNLETYLNRVLAQHPDSIVPPVVALVERSKGNEKTFQMMTSFMLNYGVKSKMMGMDKLMVELGNRYYLTGKATWADSTLIESLRKEIKKIETSLVGMKASNIYLANAEGEYAEFYSMCGEQLTVLYFFEPDCGHCKKVTPQLRDFYTKYKDDNRINVVAVYMLLDKEEWAKFIETNQLQSFTNVWDPSRVSRFWELFDTSTTPMIYVLDKDKKILAKKIDVETLEMIVKYELK
jgi:thiol-disulfide isomerase/thioredoxin